MSVDILFSVCSVDWDLTCDWLLSYLVLLIAQIILLRSLCVEGFLSWTWRILAWLLGIYIYLLRRYEIAFLHLFSLEASKLGG